MPDDVEQLAPILVALVAAWLVAGPILTVLQILHGLREKVVLGAESHSSSFKPSLDIQFRKALLENSFKPILFGWLAFFAIIAGVAGVLSWLLSTDLFLLKVLCGLVALQYVVNFFGFLYGGFRDISLMRSAIKELESDSVTEVAPENSQSTAVACSDADGA